VASILNMAVRPSRRKLMIRPKEGWQPIDFRELWHYRELLWILAVRDIRVRYKQTVLGVMWTVIQPFFQMVVFTLLFAKNGFSTDGVVAPVFYFSEVNFSRRTVFVPKVSGTPFGIRLVRGQIGSDCHTKER
jgi:hypothetical protein